MLVESSRAMFVILESNPLLLAMMPVAVKKKQKPKILWNFMVLIWAAVPLKLWYADFETKYNININYRNLSLRRDIYVLSSVFIVVISL